MRIHVVNRDSILLFGRGVLYVARVTLTGYDARSGMRDAGVVAIRPRPAAAALFARARRGGRACARENDNARIHARISIHTERRICTYLV